MSNGSILGTIGLSAVPTLSLHSIRWFLAHRARS
jgi:hypothetical protein